MSILSAASEFSPQPVTMTQFQAELCDAKGAK
ncbi:hypothetical protein SAMN06298212_10486 [Ruaniaceae bacterium KH17]|nr:hypothetical protein SAMN06298212_10486 [Ruaniaceae bacterium KH17]